MDKDLRNKISENKILTHNERAKIISDLESYEDLRSKIHKAIVEMESIDTVMFCEEMRDLCVEIIKRNIGE